MGSLPAIRSLQPCCLYFHYNPESSKKGEKGAWAAQPGKHKPKPASKVSKQSLRSEFTSQTLAVLCGTISAARLDVGERGGGVSRRLGLVVLAGPLWHVHERAGGQTITRIA